MSNVALVAVTSGNKILLLKRSPASENGDTWAFPGGHIEPDEDPHNAAARELWEETGYGTQVPLMFVSDDGIIAQYKTSTEPFTPTLNNEHTAYLWVNATDLPSPLHPGVRERIEQIMSTKRVTDLNGWVEIEANPISKVGVFPYSGRAIGAPDPAKIYQVYRPEEELSNPETVASFQLLPFVDNHPNDLLGQEADGLPTVDNKPLEGIIGEKTFYRDGYLYGNLKIFTDRIADYINAGKREVSAGFRCLYEQAQGVYNGQPYDYIQRNIRGNHVALVNEGRMGPEVAVLDRLTMTFDAKELFKMAEENKAADADKGAEGEMTLAEVTTILKAIGPQIAGIVEAMKGLTGGAAAAEADPALDADATAGKTEETVVTPAAMDAANGRIKSLEAEIKTLKEAKGLDAKDVFASQAKRDTLYAGVSRVVGAFDHSAMDAQGVAEYGVKKLGLNAPAGSEIVAVEAYLAAKPTVLTAVKQGADGKETPSAIRKHVDEARAAA